MNHQLVLRSFYQETQNSLGIHPCAFGCGNHAHFYSTRKLWRCSRWAQQCPSLSKNHSSKMTGKMAGPKNPFYGKISPFKGKKRPPETIKRMSGRTGIKHHLFGKHLPEETRRKIGESNKGKKISDKTKALMSLAAKRNALECNFPQNGFFKNVKYYKVTNI